MHGYLYIYASIYVFIMYVRMYCIDGCIACMCVAYVYFKEFIALLNPNKGAATFPFLLAFLNLFLY